MNLVKLSGMNFDEHLADPERASEAVKRVENGARQAGSGQIKGSEPTTIRERQEVVSAATPDEIVAVSGEEMVADGGYIPVVSPEYMKVPKGAPIKRDDENPDVGRIEGPAKNSVSHMTEEQFNERRLAIEQNIEGDDKPSWIIKPDIWPPFIDFPSKRDLDAIKAAEQSGALDDDQMAKFNEHFARLSVLMQMRSEQLDQWLRDENEFLDKNRSEKVYFWSSLVRRNLKSLMKERNANEIRSQKNPDNMARDPFHDIKWAVLLDPYASPDDPRFSAVARWGHNTLETMDGGVLVASDDDIYVPRGKDGTPGAAVQAVLEAIERGWTTICIDGNEEFTKQAAEEAQKYGLGAEITTHYGFLGKSKTQYIMPNPPKLDIARGEDTEAKLAHLALIGDEGKDSSEKSSPKSGARTSPGKPEDPGVEAPFDGSGDTEANKGTKSATEGADIPQI